MEGCNHFSVCTLPLDLHPGRPIFSKCLSDDLPQVDFTQHCKHFLLEELNTSDLKKKHALF